LAKQTEAYNTLKTTRDARKAELDAIYAKDDAGEEVDYEALDALEEAFGEIDGTYQEAKEHLEERQRTANNKAFNKANADATKSATRLADAIKREAEFKATKTAAEADVTKLLARIEQLKKELTQSGNSQTVQNQIIEANSALTPAFAKFEAAKTEYNLALVEKNEATTQNTTLKAALETAKKAKDSSDRKEADAARLRIRTAYEEATAARDAATLLLMSSEHNGRNSMRPPNSTLTSKPSMTNWTTLFMKPAMHTNWPLSQCRRRMPPRSLRPRKLREPLFLRQEP